jgi:hypothetical protein
MDGGAWESDIDRREGTRPGRLEGVVGLGEPSCDSGATGLNAKSMESPGAPGTSFGRVAMAEDEDFLVGEHERGAAATV